MGKNSVKKLFVLATLLLQTLVLADESQSHDQMEARDNGLAAGAMLQSFNYPDRFVGYRDYLGEITNIQSELMLFPASPRS